MQGTSLTGSDGSGLDEDGVSADGMSPERVKSMNMEGEREGRSQGATGSDSIGQLTWITLEFVVVEGERKGLKGLSILAILFVFKSFQIFQKLGWERLISNKRRWSSRAKRRLHFRSIFSTELFLIFSSIDVSVSASQPLTLCQFFSSKPNDIGC
jgi:hypothetical protein